MSPSTLDKFRVPLGSLVVDASLVVALIWWGATMTERLEQMSRRIDSLDGRGTQVQADRRLAVIETQQADDNRNMAEIREHLLRVEEKVDRLLERRR